MTAAQSLRWLLIRRLVLLQAAILTALVLLVVTALWAGGYRARSAQRQKMPRVADAGFGSLIKI